MENQAEILLNSIDDGICGVDCLGFVSYANPAAARILEAEPESLLGKTIHELLHGCAPEDGQCGENCAFRRCSMEPDRAAAGEETVYAASGHSFRAEYALKPTLHDGRLSGSVLTFRDISQRSALNRRKDEFLATASHELRTPLTSIRGALGLLAGGMLGEVSEKAASLLRIALTNSDRLIKLVNDILDQKRIESGREPLVLRPLQLAEIVRQAIEGIQPVADSACVKLDYESSQVEIAADPDRLLQVLTNLLSNAIKFSPPDSTVSVLLHAGTEGATLSVVDQGRGIPADELEAIFERFRQVDASDSHKGGGSGLGLAICRTIVLQHSGRIWAERNPVCGSTFHVFLPYHPACAEAYDEPLTEAVAAKRAEQITDAPQVVLPAP